MTEQITTEQGNKLIAEFMGATESEFGDYIIFTIHNPTYTGKIEHSEILYHTSWDWLMPVVEKIERGLPQFTPVCIEHNGCIIHNLSGETIVIENDIKIEAVWQAVVQFIQWHNEKQGLAN